IRLKQKVLRTACHVDLRKLLSLLHGFSDQNLRIAPAVHYLLQIAEHQLIILIIRYGIPLRRHPVKLILQKRGRECEQPSEPPRETKTHMNRAESAHRQAADEHILSPAVHPEQSAYELW